MKCRTKKEWYGSYERAMRALLSTPLEREKQVYFCERCGGWHLSSNLEYARQANKRKARSA